MLHENADVTEEDIRDLCRQKMARYKAPKCVFFVDGFPQTASGKIQKYKLRETATEMIGAKKEDFDYKDETA
jgi:fatty-acyl-CoA synthase